MGISFPDIRGVDEDAVYRMFYPEKHAVESMYQQPYYDDIHKELKKIGVTLKLLWQEYCDGCAKQNVISMGYTKFCEGYSNFTASHKLTNHLLHKPGIIAEVDWSGPTMAYVDRDTGEVITVYLFVATLPFSQYSYVLPCLNMKQDTWLLCHIKMYAFFGGVTIRTVCDNLKTGVIRHPKEGDIILNQHYEALGLHYMTAIMPAQVRKPKAKASVEGTVGKVATAVIAKLRNETFHSFQQLKTAVSKAMDDFNKAPFQKRDGSRLEVFETEEKQYLQPLPSIPYEIAQWFYGRKVHLDCHVVYAKNRYSCPYQYVGKAVDLKVSDSTLEIWREGERIATHTRFPDYVSNRYSTHQEDMPDQFNKPEWDETRIRGWADTIGKHTAEVIDRIFAGVQIKEQGYNPALAVLRLSEPYSDLRLEAASKLALTRIRAPRYHHLKAILSANQDKAPQISETSDQPLGGYVRGAQYYGGGGHSE